MKRTVYLPKRVRKIITLEDLVRAAHNAGATISLSLVPMRTKAVKPKKKKQEIVYGNLNAGDERLHADNP